MRLNNLVNREKGLALDLDETIFWTIGYWVEKMQELFGNPEGLSVQEMIRKYRYTDNVPYWQTREVAEWISAQNHSNSVQEELPIIDDAPFFVNTINNKVIPIASYISVRPEAVASGTAKAIRRHHFPEKPIVLRPKSIERKKSSEWKARVLEILYPKVVGIVDDNVGLVKHLSPSYRGTVFLFGHESAESDLDVVPCRDWPKVYEEVSKRFG